MSALPGCSTSSNRREILPSVRGGTESVKQALERMPRASGLEEIVFEGNDHFPQPHALIGEPDVVLELTFWRACKRLIPPLLWKVHRGNK